jgi:hypothetical protein
LLEHARNSDFAVVLFTADEVVKESDNKESLRPRDNCVFELGLFMGALGLDPQRSILLRSEDSDLLSDFVSDLGGLTYIALPAARSSEEEEKKYLKRIFGRIRDNIDDLKYCFYHPPSKELRIVRRDRLFDLETEGWNVLRSGNPLEVVVASHRSFGSRQYCHR